MPDIRILVVDDDEAVCSSLSAVLQPDAVVVKTAHTVEDAEMLVDSMVFDLAIIDLHLEGKADMEGMELIAKIKKRSPATRAVLFTAFGSAEIEQEARQRGADDYWEKTIEIPGLVERVKALGLPVGSEKRARH